MKNGIKSIARKLNRGHLRYGKNGSLEQRTKRGKWVLTNQFS